MWGHQRSAGGETFHERGAEVLGVRAREADPANSRNRANRVGELRKLPPILWIPIGVHVLAEELNLLKARCGQRFRFPNDGRHPAAPLPPAGEGDDAEGAEVVATLHDRDVGLDARNPLDLLRRNVQIVRMPPDFDDLRFAVQKSANHIRKAHEALGAEDEVHGGGPSENRGPFLLRYTARHPDQAWTLPAPPDELLHPGKDLFLCLFANRTRVEDDDSRGLAARGATAERPERRGHLFRVVDVHLTAPGLDAEAERRSLRVRRVCLRTAGCLPGCRLEQRARLEGGHSVTCRGRRKRSILALRGVRGGAVQQRARVLSGATGDLGTCEHPGDFLDPGPSGETAHSNRIAGF